MSTSIQERWPEIRTLFNKSFSSSFHYAIASVNPDGSPHVTPVGSILLDKHEPKGIYFEIFVSQLRKNVEANPEVCVLATNSGFLFWFSSLFFGRFRSIPAIRLVGKVGKRRPARSEEIALWHKRTSFLRWLRGYDLLWGNLSMVREIDFISVEAINMGKMTGK